jgi:hypothetical protein
MHRARRVLWRSICFSTAVVRAHPPRACCVCAERARCFIASSGAWHPSLIYRAHPFPESPHSIRISHAEDSPHRLPYYVQGCPKTSTYFPMISDGGQQTTKTPGVFHSHKTKLALVGIFRKLWASLKVPRVAAGCASTIKWRSIYASQRIRIVGEHFPTVRKKITDWFLSRFAPHIAVIFSSISKDFNVFPDDFRRASTNSRRSPVW